MNRLYARPHPFGKLLERFRLRRPGFTQARLAERVGYHPSVIAKMCQGKSALTGPTGRERVLRILGVLRELGAISRLEEANALLEAANMPPLFERSPTEAYLIAQLRAASIEPMSLRGRGNLPVQLTSFVGREDEIDSLVGQIKQHHLLTLTGVGGAGKTRLAQEVAAAVQNDFADGAWWVELAALTEPALLAQTITQVMRLPEQPERTHTAVLLDYFETRQLLLILDNCEHLIGACAELVHTLLRACPLLRILVTSREALNIPGEVLWSVPPLAVDQASQLFVERAQAMQPGFVRDEQNAGVIAQVCTRLDGLPLAIELAAARLRGLALAQIAARLDDRFGLLTRNHRVALPRHQTLRTLIDWSYDLLTEPERSLFQRLAVFMGGWTVEAAEAIEAEHDGPAVLDLLTQLVQKSLVVMDQSAANGGEARYHFLETIREYAQEKLAASGEWDAMRHKHAGWLLQLTQAAEPHLHSHQQKQWLDRLEREHDNFPRGLALEPDPAGGCHPRLATGRGVVAILVDAQPFQRRPKMVGGVA